MFLLVATPAPRLFIPSTKDKYPIRDKEIEECVVFSVCFSNIFAFCCRVTRTFFVDEIGRQMER